MYNIDVLILPKFELGTLADASTAGGASSDGKLGESELFYQHYFVGRSTEVIRLSSGHNLFFNNGVALLVTGEGKVNAALALSCALSNPELNFQNAYLLSTGCAGGSFETTVMGDVVVVAAAIDYDLGHRVDSSELGAPDGPNSSVWFRDASLNSSACKVFDETLTTRVFELVKDTPIATTPLTRSVMARNFADRADATRDPRVQIGTTVSGDNYWKGVVGHNVANHMVKHYGCTYPYMTTDMEDAALAHVADSFGMLNRFISIRDVVDMDIFLNNNTPETLWGNSADFNALVQNVNPETADIWVTSRHNNFDVCARIINAIQSHQLLI